MQKNNSKSVAILTLGCRVNQSESSVIEGTLRQHGISIVSLDENPDYCIVNTCTVTGRSDANSRHLIRKAARTGADVIVTGCYSELRKDEVCRIKGVCKVIPTDQKDSIIGLITENRDSEVLYNLHARARPFLKVQDGCNFRCSYCAVPIARGSSKSIPIATAVRRAQEITEGGYQEIVLTGIHLGSYGQDLDPKSNICGLVKAILKHTNIKRIRLSSIEINEVNDELTELLTDKRICDHLHIPLQSGNDRLLKLMNRQYTAKAFEKKLSKIKSINPDIAIGMDVITGFPTESDEEHMSTLSLLKNLPISYMHIFPFSLRSGTPAVDLKPQISDYMIRKRAESLKQLDLNVREHYASFFIGKTVEVIMEDRDDSGYITGTSSNYLKVRIPDNGVKRGSLVFVRLQKVNTNIISGCVITRQ